MCSIFDAWKTGFPNSLAAPFGDVGSRIRIFRSLPVLQSPPNPDVLKWQTSYLQHCIKPVMTRLPVSMKKDPISELLQQTSVPVNDVPRTLYPKQQHFQPRCCHLLSSSHPPPSLRLARPCPPHPCSCPREELGTLTRTHRERIPRFFAFPFKPVDVALSPAPPAHAPLHPESCPLPFHRCAITPRPTFPDAPAATGLGTSAWTKRQVAGHVETCITPSSGVEGRGSPGQPAGPQICPTDQG